MGYVCQSPRNDRSRKQKIRAVLHRDPERCGCPGLARRPGQTWTPVLNLALIWLSSGDAHTRLQPADTLRNPISCSRVLELTFAIFRAEQAEERGGQRAGAAKGTRLWSILESELSVHPINSV